MELVCIITDDDATMLKYRVEHKVEWLKKQGAKIKQTEIKVDKAFITYDIPSA